jgi:proline iminopeptidase
LKAQKIVIVFAAAARRTLIRVGFKSHRPSRAASTMSSAPGPSAARALYPPIEPYETGFLDVGQGHRVFYEVSGNPAGKPAVFLHGGPGSGTTPKMRQFFDSAKYKIVMFDQRGSGKSTPFANLDNNSVWDLVADAEALRTHLKISKWLVFGGSWGSTLALAYAETHPQAVSELVLRGIFLLRRSELEWFYQEGASHIFPDAWEKYLEPIPEAERGDLIAAYHRRLIESSDEAEQLRACKAWSVWEGATSKLFPDEDFISHYEDDGFALSFARIENHYFTEWRKWVQPEDKLLRDVDRIRNIPAVIVQGRYDLVCPMKSAWDLHRAWPEASFVLVHDAGHSAWEPGTQRALLDATDRFA